MAKLEEFIEHVLRITPKYINAFGTGMPGMAGTSAATSGAFNTAGDITHNLHHAVAAFARCYTDAKTSLETLEAHAKIIEGMLLAEEAVSALDERQSRQLQDELYDLMEQKR